MTEMLIPAKCADDIDWLRYGHRGWHGLRHRLAWAVMPECIRALVIAGLMVANHPGDMLDALFTKFLEEQASAAAEAEEEARR